VSIGNQQSLRRYARPLFVSSAKSDKDVPFSFRDWYNAYQGVIPGEEFKQYNEYLVNWYKDKSLEVTDFNLQLKLNYLTLLKQLQLFFSKEEAENWYNKVNINNEKELLLSIPYFAKKLKDIALYYLQLREAIKESRLKYNQVGANSGIVQQIQKFLLTNYTQKPNSSISIPATVWRNVPELSAVKDSITVQIEELYDTKTYFDRSPTMPVSAYYNVNSAELQNFLTTRGLAISSTEWIYKLGVFPLSADYISLSGGDLTELSQRLSEKYLGQDKYVAQTPSVSARQDFLNVSLETGNNFLFWPSGTYRTKAKTNPRYKATPINESGLSTNATAGSSIELADTVFIKTARGVEGAWFRNNLYDFKSVTMQATLESDTKTAFRFPFPGFGLSAEDIQWTGFDLSTDPRFFFLSDEIREGIENIYWSSSINLTASTPLLINDTTLVDNKAYPNRDYNRSDKIRVWTTPPNYTDSAYSGEVNEAWLYRMNNTDISIQLSGDNVIVWPYEKIDPVNDFPTYYPKNISQVCQPLPVSAIDFSKAIAGQALSSSDVIYKLTNYQDNPDLALEGCWLSGETINYPETKLITTRQGALQILAAPGEYVKFIWSGNDNTDVETVFKTIQHQPDCKFVNTPGVTYKDFGLCNCRQVNFTPFGHPGNQYADNNRFADFIIEDNFSPGNLDLEAWRDSSGTSYTESSAFCWYKTNNNFGWGDGRWFSGNLSAGNSFYLQNGKAYVYYRAAITNTGREDVVLPSLVVRYPYNSTNQLWVRAYKDENNEWQSANTPSQMVVTPGDLLLYRRAQNVTYSLSGSTIQDIDISENRGSIWTSFDYISIGELKQFVLSYPTAIYTNPGALNAANPSRPQYPALNSSNLVSVLQWSVSAPNSPLQVYRNTPSVIITPSSTGIYSFSVTAVSAAVLPPQTIQTGTTLSYQNTGLFIFTNIPAVTAIPNTELVPSLTSYNTPAPGYVLTTPLKGWDYNLGIQNQFSKIENAGARPFWAKTYIQKDQNTDFRGIEAWGTPIRFLDEYNLITQPEISDIVLETGNHVEYTRNNPVDLTWNQPLDLTVTVDKDEWCTLEVNTTGASNLQDQLTNYKNDLIVTPTTATSNLTFQSFVDNEPVEVYYNALNSFVWNITAVPEIPETVFGDVSATLAIEARQPWANLPNQFYPTVAMFPAFDELYSTSDIGGFFTPSNIGTTLYIDQDYTATLDISSKAILQYFEDANKRPDGRGLTKQDQLSPYENITENNIWLKEPTVAGPIAGTIKKSIFKKYQKFLPYQSGYESNPRLRVGLLTPTSRQSPWTGKEDSEWGDLQNKPTTFTGEIDVESWANSQVLKQAGLQIDNWVTDVFGNQYGLYKNLSGVPIYNRKNTDGEIWTRKNSQYVSPAYASLSGVFDTYANTSLVNELTGNGVRKIDLFFDTLLVETSGAVIFEKVNYDYNLDDIFSVADEARYLSLAMPVSANLDREFADTNLVSYNFAKAGETWFFPEEKAVAQSVCGIQNFILTPELYLLNLNNQNLTKIFPVTQEDITAINTLSSLNITSIEPPVLSHNALKKEYLLTVLGKNNENQNIVIEFKINDLSTKSINTLTVYAPTPATTPLDPPVINQTLRVSLDITNIEYENALNFQCIAENGPVVFESVDVPSWITLSPTGLFTGTPPFATTTYNALFKVTNSVGPTFYSLIIDVDYTEILTIYYLYTEGYELSGDNGFLLQEDEDRIIE
jgi:hypothetical protein